MPVAAVAPTHVEQHDKHCIDRPAWSAFTPSLVRLVCTPCLPWLTLQAKRKYLDPSEVPEWMRYTPKELEEKRKQEAEARRKARKKKHKQDSSSSSSSSSGSSSSDTSSGRLATTADSSCCASAG